MPGSKRNWAQQKVNTLRAKRHLATQTAAHDLKREEKLKAEAEFRGKSPEEIEELRRQRRARSYYLRLYAAHLRRHGPGE